MKHISRLVRVQYITDPDTGRIFPIPAGGAGEGSGDGGEGGEGSGDGKAGEGQDGEGSGAGEGAGGEGQDGEGAGSGGQPTPLEQQALDAVKALKDAGTEIPKALEQAVKEFRDARKEAGNHRTAKNAAESKLDAVLKALGIDDGEPDPAALKASLDAKDSEVRDATVRLDAYKTATKQGANPEALLDSASFLAKVAKLDPSSDSYQSDLESAIKTAVETNPLLAASPGGGRGPFQGPSPSPESRPKSLGDAVASRYRQ